MRSQQFRLWAAKNGSVLLRVATDGPLTEPFFPNLLTGFSLDLRVALWSRLAVPSSVGITRGSRRSHSPGGVAVGGQRF